jgi:hypothetical protein
MGDSIPIVPDLGGQPPGPNRTQRRAPTTQPQRRFPPRPSCPATAPTRAGDARRRQALEAVAQRSKDASAAAEGAQERRRALEAERQELLAEKQRRKMAAQVGRPWGGCRGYGGWVWVWVWVWVCVGGQMGGRGCGCKVVAQVGRLQGVGVGVWL